MPFELGAGLVLQVDQPAVPVTLVVPATGPAGPQGPQGTPAEIAGAHAHTQSSPALLAQIIHGLSFKPAGIVCIETDGTVIEFASITHPSPGITEVTFGVPFVGTIFVS